MSDDSIHCVNLPEDSASTRQNCLGKWCLHHLSLEHCGFCGRGELDPSLGGLAVYMPSSRRGGLLLFSDAKRSQVQEDKC